MAVSTPDGAGLHGLGVTLAEQQVYELLLGRPDLTIAELGEQAGLRAGRLRGLLKSLEDKGMLTRMPGRPTWFVPAPPDLAVEVLALRRQGEIERARVAGAALGGRVRHTGDSPIQLMRGRETVVQRFRQVQQLAKRELLILDKPPYVVEPGAQLQLQHELQAGGVRYRTIYDREALDTAGRVEELRQLAASGEEARVLTGVPMKLLIADRRVGLVPHDLRTDRQVMLVRPSALLDGLITLFDTLWAQAAPLWPHARQNQLSVEDQQLLALLATGLTDQAIARRLGVAQRTVERRVRRVMDGLGARTRFQAGLAAAGRGHLVPGSTAISRTTTQFGCA